MSLFGEKEFQQGTRYPTPVGIPDGYTCVTLHIPDDPSWWAIYVGLLYALTQEDAWQQFEEGITVEQAAAVAAAVFDDALDRAATSEGCGMDCSNTLCDGPTWTPPDTLIYQYDDGVLQVSADGGTTWDDVPLANVPDPVIPPLTATAGASDDAKACLASQRAVNTLSALYQQTAGAVAADLANTLSALNNVLAEINWALAQIVMPSEVTGLVHLLGWDVPNLPTDFSDPALDADAKAALLCLLLANASVSAAGLVTFDWQAVFDNVIAELGANPGTAVTLLLSYLGGDGLNRAGNVENTDTADCSDCIPFSFIRLGGAGNSNLTALTSDGSYNFAAPTYQAAQDRYSAGIDTGSPTIRVAAVEHVFDNPVTITHLLMGLDLDFTFASSFNQQVKYQLDGESTWTNLIDVAKSADFVGNLTWDGEVANVKKLRWRWAGQTDTGRFYLTRIEVAGTGL